MKLNKKQNTNKVVLKLFKQIYVLAIILTLTGISFASVALDVDYSYFSRIGNDADLLWRTPQYTTLYIPAITWHNRYTYDQKDIDKYNEKPWGLGIGLEREDKYKWSSLYVMTFQDSFRKWEPILGYGKEWRKPLDQNADWRAGIGYTFGVTLRDNWNYIPIPVLLPMASINYKRASFQATYIPGTYGNGNVFFAWFRFQIPTVN